MNNYTTIYLNTFNKKKVLAVVTKLMKSEDPKLMFTFDYVDKYWVLSYNSLIHTVHIGNFNPSDPLFINSNCACLIASESDFITAIKPSEEFELLMHTEI